MRLIERTRVLRARRSALGTLVVRDLRVRYAQSWLGYFWTVLDPLLMSLIYYFVFVVVFKKHDLGHDPYFLFLVIGLLAWQWFSATLTDSSRALIQESKLVRSTNLPREIWVVRVVLSKGAEYLFSLPVLVAFLVLYLLKGQVHLNQWLFLFPVGVILECAALVGIGLILAPITALVTDLQRVVRIVLRMLFYATPVVYTGHLVPHPYDKVLWINPLTGVLEMMRAGFFNHSRFPIIWGAVGASVVISVLLVLVGVTLFGRMERAVLKEI